MATANIKVKNGKVAQDVLTEATRAAEEAKEIMDTMLEATNKVVEDSKPILQSYQKLLETNFTLWQEFNRSTLNIVNKYAQLFLDDWFALREEWSKATEANLKKSQEIYVAEQTLAFEAAEAFQAQFQAVSERTVKMFTPISTN